MQVDVLPLGDADKKIVDALAESLRKKGFAIRILKPKEIPKSFNKAREQYDALRIISRVKGSGVLAVMADDIFDDGMNFVYGLANAEGSAVVSYFRLRPEFYGEAKSEKKLVERLVKESMHEIGHMLGMKHCTHKVGTKPCVMTFSTNIHEVDGKASAFCAEHAKMLE